MSNIHGLPNAEIRMEFGKNPVGSISCPITEEDIETVIVNGFEGGIGYWAGLDNSGKDWEEIPKGVATSEWATKLLLDGKSIKLYDREETDDDSFWILTLDKLIKGIELNTKERHWDNSIENGDATTYDCIIQYALFGEVVYG